MPRNDGDTNTLTFEWNVQADTAPTFGLTASVPAKKWAPNQAIAGFTMPAATGTGTGTGTAIVNVTDCDGDTDSLRFSRRLTVEFKPAFAAATLTNRDWNEGQTITTFTVRAVTGGDGSLTYTAAGLPSGVTMSSSRSVSGTPGNSGSGTAMVTATDADGDTASIRFAWAVSPGPGDRAFGAGTVAAKDWIVSRTIPSLLVPAATGGDGTLTYSIENLPDGVSMSTDRKRIGRQATEPHLHRA